MSPLDSLMSPTHNLVLLGPWRYGAMSELDSLWTLGPFVN